ncbi:MAG: RluA family pseudouridine synthase, partial [Clostridiales bacterium]|nr:RluA family pseudouridine synthase [Clostridiales bacterium]
MSEIGNITETDIDPELYPEDEGNELILVVTEDVGTRLDAWVSSKVTGFSRTYIQKLVEDGSITVNGKSMKTNYKVKQDDNIVLNVPLAVLPDIIPENIPLDIIYEDNDIIVINKSKGMVVHPAAGNYTGTVVNALMAHCGSSLSDINGVIRPGIVHRIDKDTTGILVIAKNNRSHEELSKLFKIHSISRVYKALVEGVIREETGTIDAPIGRHHTDRKKMSVNMKNGRRAVTHFKVLERFSEATFIEVTLETGRTHQIRVHMAYIGHPVLGDTVYGKKNQPFKTEGQVLHAGHLGFIHPTAGEMVEFDSDLPL